MAMCPQLRTARNVAALASGTADAASPSERSRPRLAAESLTLRRHRRRRPGHWSIAYDYEYSSAAVACEHRCGAAPPHMVMLANHAWNAVALRAASSSNVPS